MDHETFINRQCGSKVRHPDQEAAQRHADRLKQELGSKARPYPCPFCGRWHVGHKHKRKVS